MFYLSNRKLTGSLLPLSSCLPPSHASLSFIFPFLHLSPLFLYYASSHCNMGAISFWDTFISEISLRLAIATQWEPVSNINKYYPKLKAFFTVEWYNILHCCYFVYSTLQSMSRPPLLSHDRKNSVNRCSALEELTGLLTNRTVLPVGLFGSAHDWKQFLLSGSNISLAVTWPLTSKMNAEEAPTASMCMLQTEPTRADLLQEGEMGRYHMQYKSNRECSPGFHREAEPPAC